jgi:hypothetical protein
MNRLSTSTLTVLTNPNSASGAGVGASPRKRRHPNGLASVESETIDPDIMI